MSKTAKSQKVNCEQENKTVVVSWLEVSLDPYVTPISRNFSCNRIFECQTKYGTIDNIPDSCAMKKMA
jgi:hypothetical protein